MNLALAIAALSGAFQSACTLAQVQACDAMYELVDRVDFKTALRRFLGSGRATWTEIDTDKTEQVLTTLAVSAGGPVKLNNGLIMMGGCYPHNCPERAQVFFALTGEIRAVVLLYHDCGRKKCTGMENPTLRILLRRHSPHIIKHARDWGNNELVGDARAFPWRRERIARTVIQVLTD